MCFGYFKNYSDRILIIIEALCCFRMLNIGSVMVGLFDPAIIKNEFSLPDYIEPTALIFLGYPINGFLSPERHNTERKPINETVFYESFI